MVLNEKPTKNWKLRGLKLRGLGQNQISTPHSIYENDHRNKINILRDFEDETPTHMSATHAILKISRKIKKTANVWTANISPTTVYTPDNLYQNDRRNKIYTLSYFENQTPTHMSATHAISKSEHKF